jgi:hypothetical protein
MGDSSQYQQLYPGENTGVEFSNMPAASEYSQTVEQSYGGDPDGIFSCIDPSIFQEGSFHQRSIDQGEHSNGPCTYRIPI